MGEALDVAPTTLAFRFELKKQSATVLTLANPSASKHVAFKVKTTQPKKYCVRPNQGVVEPGKTTEVQVIMSPQNEMPADLEKHKFLVQALQVDGDVKVSRELFDAEGAKVSETKLKVNYTSPPPPPSPVPEETEEPRGGGGGAAAGAGGRDGDAATLRAENMRLKDSVKRLEAEAKLMAKDGPARVAFAGGFTLVHILIIAILAFLLGRFV